VKIRQRIFINPSIDHSCPGMRLKGVGGRHLSSFTDSDVWRAKGLECGRWRGAEVGDAGESSLRLAGLKFDLKW
jgi:hypothetical protein